MTEADREAVRAIIGEELLRFQRGIVAQITAEFVGMLKDFADQLCEAQSPMVRELVEQRECLQTLVNGINDAAEQMQKPPGDDWWKYGGEHPV